MMKDFQSEIEDLTPTNLHSHPCGKGLAYSVYARRSPRQEELVKALLSMLSSKLNPWLDPGHNRATECFQNSDDLCCLQIGKE